LAGGAAATVAVFVLSLILPNDVEGISNIQRTQAVKAVIYFYSLLTLGTAMLVWFYIPDTQIEKTTSHRFPGVTKVLRNRLAWLQAIIVVCVYYGYRGLDFYTLYGTDVLGMSEVDAVRLVSYSTYLRPVAAVGAGFLADRFTSKKVIGSAFTLLLFSYIMLVFLSPGPKVSNIIFINLFFTFFAIYALRGVYFALFEETNIAGSLTGTTVGLISVVGFAPDMFFNSIAGRILDASPGIKGFHDFYLFLCLFAVLGIIATLFLARISKKMIPGVQHD